MLNYGTATRNTEIIILANLLSANGTDSDSGINYLLNDRTAASRAEFVRSSRLFAAAGAYVNGGILNLSGNRSTASIAELTARLTGLAASGTNVYGLGLIVAGAHIIHNYSSNKDRYREEHEKICTCTGTKTGSVINTPT